MLGQFIINDLFWNNIFVFYTNLGFIYIYIQIFAKIIHKFLLTKIKFLMFIELSFSNSVSFYLFTKKK